VSANPIIHVVVAVIRNDAGQVLLSLRPEHVHQGGLWEFPGGKLEDNESVEQGLARELQEELGIETGRVSPLIRIRHDYEDRAVLLDVWEVQEYRNTPYGKENQRLDWVDIDDLSVNNMPAADLPIIHAIRLPDRCLITPDVKVNTGQFLSGLKKSLESGVKLIQFRSKGLADSEYLALANEIVSLSRSFDARVIINNRLDVFQQSLADGLHLNSQCLMEADKRPVAEQVLLSASCHNQAEVERANKLAVDFIMLSPVLPTKSHPYAEPIGWEQFQLIAESACMPVYALGGMNEKYISHARKQGAQGIAAISSLWGG